MNSYSARGFGPEFEDLYEIDRKKDFSGDASLVYSWSVEE